MARPRKNAAEQPELDEQDGEELVELDHFIEFGSMTIDGESYEIKNGKVLVKPEHVLKVRRHIAMGS